MNQIETKTFNEFWKVYVLAHQNKKNQAFHFLAALASILLGVGFFFWHKLMLLVLMPVISYSLAWFGHLFHEKNEPLTWTYPVYSLIADYRMFLLLCFGKMEQEVAKMSAAAPTSV